MSGLTDGKFLCNPAKNYNTLFTYANQHLQIQELFYDLHQVKMHSTQLLAAALSVAGFVAAAPQIQPGKAGCPQNICIDGINPACPTVRWGG